MINFSSLQHRLLAVHFSGLAKRLSCPPGLLKAGDTESVRPVARVAMHMGDRFCRSLVECTSQQELELALRFVDFVLEITNAPGQVGRLAPNSPGCSSAVPCSLKGHAVHVVSHGRNAQRHDPSFLVLHHR
jgi:hypothetical protein